jgi:cyclophilin family peptidyl-prolyl cis-trans isomerase
MIPRPIVPLVLLAVACATLACSASPATSPPPPATAAPSVAAGGADCPTAQPESLPAGETRAVTIATDLGTMTLTIEADLSPIAAGNFVALAGCGFYDGVVFHRVVPGFVIQGGDPTGTGTGGPGYTIKDEAVTTPYARGTVAMARTPAPDSVGSQFFIVLDDEARGSLAQANTYQIIGSVTAGMETADAIAAAADAELPSDPVTMTDVSVAQ